LTCGVALPVFAGEFLMAVMVLFCGDDEKHVGAIELWHNDPEVSHEMGLVDGYYGTADMFEFNSRHTKFPAGFGLPGRAWKAGMPLDHQGPAQRQEFSALGGSERDRDQLRRRHSLHDAAGSDLGDDLPVSAGNADRADVLKSGCRTRRERSWCFSPAIAARMPIWPRFMRQRR
jgi:hypothetical protein